MFSLLFSFKLRCMCFCDHLAFVKVRIKKLLTYLYFLVPGQSALRSAAHGDIVVPSHRTECGLRSFAVAGPSNWNALPVGLTPFSFNLETFAMHLNVNVNVRHTY